MTCVILSKKASLESRNFCTATGFDDRLLAAVYVVYSKPAHDMPLVYIVSRSCG
jgi:hypothetical protein